HCSAGRIFRAREDQVGAPVLDGGEQGGASVLGDSLRHGAGERGAALELCNHGRPLCLQPHRLELGELIEQRVRGLASRLRRSPARSSPAQSRATTGSSPQTLSSASASARAASSFPKGASRSMVQVRSPRWNETVGAPSLSNAAESRCCPWCCCMWSNRRGQ